MGELARKPGAPTLPLTPEELFTPGPGQGFAWYDKYLAPICLAITSAAGPAVRNWTLSRPYFAGIYQHILMGGIGYIIGRWYIQFRNNQRSEKDAILLHYMSLHPEDFPPFERQRYKDLFLSWSPKR